MLKTLMPPRSERVDYRGRFCEIISEGSWQAIIHGEMNEGAVLGNQYHAVTRCYLYVIAGAVDLDLMDIGTREKRRIRLTDGKGSYIEPGTSHAVRFRRPTEFILLKSKPYDPSDRDRFPYDIEDEDQSSANLVS